MDIKCLPSPSVAFSPRCLSRPDLHHCEPAKHPGSELIDRVGLPDNKDDRTDPQEGRGKRAEAVDKLLGHLRDDYDHR